MHVLLTTVCKCSSLPPFSSFALFRFVPLRGVCWPISAIATFSLSYWAPQYERCIYAMLFNLSFLLLN